LRWRRRAPVAEALPGEHEIVEITTAGDRGAPPGSDKSRWVAELERALQDGEADVAVHSAKDVPGMLLDGLDIVAVPARADAPRRALRRLLAGRAFPPAPGWARAACAAEH